MILWLNPIAGISGDMMLGALLDLGAPIETLREAIASTGITGWTLDVESVERQGVRALHAVVDVDDVVSERHAHELITMAERARPREAADLAAAAVRALARIESRIHDTPVESVHLHELGGVDTIVDTVGVASALHALDIDEVWSGPVGLGVGQTRAAHGIIPVPAPATLELLRGSRVRGIDSDTETVTPTGAALLAAANTRYGPVPEMTMDAVGYGAGTRDTPGRPNVLTAVLGTRLRSESRPDAMIVLDTTVDDVTGEILGELIPALLTAGAADAWITPVVGKKNRPAHVISALCTPSTMTVVEECLLTRTGSLGVRRTHVDRRTLPRHMEVVNVDGHDVRVKVGPHRSKPEHDDLVAVSTATGVPLRSVAERVQTLVNDHHTHTHTHPHTH
ncbi:TIGR00299 family protein [Rhodococcus sp. 02-925g]|uniref:nickel pincer cofactor biosynthesis protein LarC n=1 Tax=Rhodococcus sp. 02-925g TaxID=2022503 RepID=UPI000B9BA0F6|nr:nickel pincer cofactor biosynthesis protein LarC [Rhodococcus sp. 02-925g]OZE63419.1 TIGR00299 family protein [Rhodococcus sp. 02-925g]